MTACPINPLVTPAQCGGMYKRALENRNNPEINKCLLCGRGKNYQVEYQQEHEYLNNLGSCDNCGKGGHIELITINGKTWHLCSVCKVGIRRARKAGVAWEDVKDEIKERALGTIIRGRKHTYSFERGKEGSELRMEAA